MTTIETLQEAWRLVDAKQADANVKLKNDPSTRGEVLRELALSKTAIEDAMMRFNRGEAKLRGIFHVADLEKPPTSAASSAGR